MIRPVARDGTIGELLAALGRRAPWSKAAEWDPVGLQLGDPDAPARTVAVCHEVTGPVVAALEADPVDLLVSYHPLLFRATTRLVAGPGAGGRAWRLARAGIGLAIAHTNFDAAPGGAADALADALDLHQVEGFAPVHGSDSVKIATFLPADAADPVLQAVARVGAGVIGNYTHCSFRAEGAGSFFAEKGSDPVVGRRGALNLEPEVRLEFVAPRAREEEVLAALVAAHPYEEPAYDVYDRRGEPGLVGRVGRAPARTTLDSLAERVMSALRRPALRIAGPLDRPLERVAVVPGSGGDFVSLCARIGADAIVTGDLSHHRTREALDLGLCALDPGHAATERPGVERLLEWVSDLAPECVSLLDLDPDPWTAARA
jgi:dinuclear metal center YbgI/SA1388 family protein